MVKKAQRSPTVSEASWTLDDLEALALGTLLYVARLFKEDADVSVEILRSVSTDPLLGAIEKGQVKPAPHTLFKLCTQVGLNPEKVEESARQMVINYRAILKNINVFFHWQTARKRSSNAQYTLALGLMWSLALVEIPALWVKKGNT